ncbi:MAG: methyltransferase domain-containing protein [Halobacteriales archaeon]|nr:methyltransferase domain-containing protein [Halobacteriales archaeon]
MADRDRNDDNHKSRTAESFGENSFSYAESPAHRMGDDLETLRDWVSESEPDRVLDVATGAGHTAGAVGEAVGEETLVCATDISPEMVRTAVSRYDVEGVVADAEELPFVSSSFDAVTCRIAAHHFPNPRAFLEEVRRVLSPDGVFAFEDNVAPDDDELDAFLNEVERTRDPTHVRSYTVGEWERWLDEAGFEVHEASVVKKNLDYETWIESLDTPEENRERVETLLREPPIGNPEQARELFEISCEDGEVESFSNLKLLVLAGIP